LKAAPRGGRAWWHEARWGLPGVSASPAKEPLDVEARSHPRFRSSNVDWAPRSTELALATLGCLYLPVCEGPLTRSSRRGPGRRPAQRESQASAIPGGRPREQKNNGRTRGRGSLPLRDGERIALARSRRRGSAPGAVWSSSVTRRLDRPSLRRCASDDPSVERRKRDGRGPCPCGSRTNGSHREPRGFLLGEEAHDRGPVRRLWSLSCRPSVGRFGWSFCVASRLEVSVRGNRSHRSE